MIRVPPVSHLKRDKTQLVERVNSLQSSIDQSMATLKVSSRTFAVAKSPNLLADGSCASWTASLWLTLFTQEFLQQPTSINESFKINFIGADEICEQYYIIAIYCELLEKRGAGLFSLPTTRTHTHARTHTHTRAPHHSRVRPVAAPSRASIRTFSLVRRCFWRS